MAAVPSQYWRHCYILRFR